jgi:hypothetical protein
MLCKLDRSLPEPTIHELPLPGTLVVPSSELQNPPIGHSTLRPTAIASKIVRASKPGHRLPWKVPSKGTSIEDFVLIGRGRVIGFHSTSPRKKSRYRSTIQGRIMGQELFRNNFSSGITEFFRNNSLFSGITEISGKSEYSGISDLFQNTPVIPEKILIPEYLYFLSHFVIVSPHLSSSLPICHYLSHFVIIFPNFSFCFPFCHSVSYFVIIFPNFSFCFPFWQN